MVAISEVGSTLNDLAVDPDVVRDILEMLESGADDLHAHPVGEVPDGAFGPGTDAVDLAVNTAKAHRHVKEAMDDMVAGLRGFTVNIKDFAERAHVADDESATQLQALQASTTCVAAPSFSAPSSCTLPTDGGA
ncbi:hypothetical protein ACT8ZV_00120 [Nocardioides sp. MAHUQ-72]|uniref:hypothetical protein n=1 Tax=unclassified Nocardioides TaxID=2615069 RepID=UPI00360AF592